MQRKLVRKLDLERFISKIETHPLPKAYLEQYTIPADLAAEVLYVAAYVYDDIIGKTVVDLGCGTGRLALGAAYLGARKVIGIDIDKTAVNVAIRNAEMLELEHKTNWIVGDISMAIGSFDTVLQNPPFGVQKRGADRNFITKSIELGNSIYTLHKGGKCNKKRVSKFKDFGTESAQDPLIFVRNLIKKKRGKIVAIFPMQMVIPKIFEFHQKRKHKYMVYLFVIKSGAARKLANSKRSQ